MQLVQCDHLLHLTLSLPHPMLPHSKVIALIILLPVAFPIYCQVSPTLPVLANLIYSEDVDTLSDACWAISYLSDGPNDKVQTVIEAGVCRRLVELLMHDHYKVVSAALRAVGNIVTGDDVQTQVSYCTYSYTCIYSHGDLTDCTYVPR